MLPFVIATAVWGSKWKGGTVELEVRFDNTAAVSIINQGTSRHHQAIDA